MYGDDFDPSSKSTILCNHKTMYDIRSAFYISGYFDKVIGFCLKKQVSYIPGIGRWCTYLNFPILNRNKDDVKILEVDSTPFPVIIYPEGTRFSDDGYRKSYQFAKQNDYPISKYAMLPKTRGSFALSGNKRTIYQMTLVYMDEHQRIMKARNCYNKVYYYI